MAEQKQYRSVIDEMIEQLQKNENEVGYKMTVSEDRARFGFPEHLTKPLSKQFQDALVSPGQGQVQQKFKPHINDKQFKDANKQLQLPASSTIQQAAYWPNKEYLVVSFKSGHTYDYKGVELLSVLLWEQASSAGSWFYYNIRMRYPYRKIS